MDSPWQYSVLGETLRTCPIPDGTKLLYIGFDSLAETHSKKSDFNQNLNIWMWFGLGSKTSEFFVWCVLK